MTLIAVKSDAQIQRDVIRELKWDTRVEETDVGVEVDDGVVTLTGTVPSFAARHAAQQAAHEVGGVKDVVNNVHVRAAGVRTDTDIAHSIRHTLEWDPRIPHERIQTTVSDGWVTLAGEVDRWSERTDAERAVRRLSGVGGVTNTIVVAAPKVDAVTIKESIEEALERRAERQADRVRVEVHDGVVTLDGSVRSYGDMRAISGATRQRANSGARASVAYR